MSGYHGIVTTASIKSIKGNFKLNSLRLESAVNEIVELKIEGYRDNTFVTGAVVINQYMPFEKIDVPLTGNHGKTSMKLELVEQMELQIYL